MAKHSDKFAFYVTDVNSDGFWDHQEVEGIVLIQVIHSCATDVFPEL